MGDIGGQQNDHARVFKGITHLSPYFCPKHSTPGHGTLPSDDAATPATAAGAPPASRYRSASYSALPLPHARLVVPGTAPDPSDNYEAATSQRTAGEMIASHFQSRAAEESVTDMNEHPVKLNKGKGRARSSSDPTKPVSDFSSKTTDDLSVVHSALSTPRSCTAPRSISSRTTSTSVREAKPIYSVNEGHDDYPHIHEPRSVPHRGRLPYEPRQNLPRPLHMRGHRRVTSYAGQPLFRLCSSVPYVLGSLALVTRLQLIVETPVLLPDEAIDLLAERGIDVATLDGYDLALLNVLCCLWND